MNWRTVVGICAGALLPLPLVLLGGLLRPPLHTETPTEIRISPMLDTEQRMRLRTYGQHCGQDAECEPPLGCLFDVRFIRSYCLDSECLTDAQCPESMRCRILATWRGVPRLRRCVPVGPRQEGEACVPFSEDKENSCAAQWVCGGDESRWCARPCHLGDSQGCPQGFFCADTVPEPVCLPTCETRECPSGQQCIAFSEGASVCAQVYGPNCQQTPCPDGRECKVNYDPRYPGKAWMECAERCGEGEPTCGADKVCDGWHCLPACDPHGPEVCTEGYHCSRRGEGRPFACQPRYWTEETP